MHPGEMEEISERLLDQRLRNRVMEVVWSQVEWQESLRTGGFAEHFESFFDFFPYEGEPHANGAMTQQEREAVVQVHRLVIDAMASTPSEMTEAEYAATGWPQRIEPAAERALRLMLKRGRFSEEQEEAEPSMKDGWPWRDRFRSSK